MAISRRRRGRPTVLLTATAEERTRLRAMAQQQREPSLAQRARIVLGCLEGSTNLEVARNEGVTSVTVGKWRRRFASSGLYGLEDAPRCGGPRSIDDERIAEVVRLTREGSPPDAGRWTTRSLGRHVGVSHTTVSRIWREHDLSPAAPPGE